MLEFLEGDVLHFAGCKFLNIILKLLPFVCANIEFELLKYFAQILLIFFIMFFA